MRFSLVWQINWQKDKLAEQAPREREHRKASSAGFHTKAIATVNLHSLLGWPVSSAIDKMTGPVKTGLQLSLGTVLTLRASNYIYSFISLHMCMSV